MEYPELSHRELEEQHGTALPERRLMALLNINTIVAANTAAAVNVLTEDSLAAAFADQLIVVDQS